MRYDLVVTCELFIYNTIGCGAYSKCNCDKTSVSLCVVFMRLGLIVLHVCSCIGGSTFFLFVSIEKRLYINGLNGCNLVPLCSLCNDEVLTSMWDWRLLILTGLHSLFGERLTEQMLPGLDFISQTGRRVGTTFTYALTLYMASENCSTGCCFGKPFLHFPRIWYFMTTASWHLRRRRGDTIY